MKRVYTSLIATVSSLAVLSCEQPALSVDAQAAARIEPGASQSAISIPQGAVAVPLRRLGLRQYVEAYVASVMAPLRSADTDKDGLDQDDIILKRQQELATRRASVIGLILALDTNGDRRVTRQEVLSWGVGLHLARDPWRYDGNADGVVTLDEIAAKVAADPAPDSASDLVALLALDPSGDGVLKAAELEALARRTFATADSDGDGQISQAEFDSFRALSGQTPYDRHPVGPSISDCSAPAAPPDAQVVVLGAYEGTAMADVTLAGRDTPTSAATLYIEPGKLPLYVILASHDPIIWRLKGATGRVARIVVSSQAVTATGVSASGVSAFPASKITALPRDCVQAFYPGQGRGLGGRTRLDAPRAQTIRLLGRGPDIVTGAYALRQASLPSGKIEEPEGRSETPAPPGFDAEAWKEAVRFAPDGLMRFDPDAVGGAVRAQRYDVLPQEFGLAQLTASGALRRDGRGRYRLVKPIARFPAGLAGAHGVAFTVARGVPTPGGDPAHSSVTFEDGREPIGVRR